MLLYLKHPNHGEVNGCDRLEEDEKDQVPFSHHLTDNSTLASFAATRWAMMGTEELNTLFFLVELGG